MEDGRWMMADVGRLKSDVISIFIVGDFRKFFNIFGFNSKIIIIFLDFMCYLITFAA